ncbi:hypothetical protein C3L33_06991, partial [Rhododendron williamsianum]
MGSPKKNQGKGLFAAMTSGISMFGNAMQRSVTGLLGYEGVEVINPEGGKDDAEEEAVRGRWKQEPLIHFFLKGSGQLLEDDAEIYGSDVTSMVTLPVIIFEPMTMLQKMAELMEYSYLLDQADECEDPYMRLVYACEYNIALASWAISVYYAYQRTWKPFNPILGETYEMVNHGAITFISEQVCHHPPMSAGHAENEHFTYDVTSKLKTKFLGNSLDVYPLGRLGLVAAMDVILLIYVWFSFCRTCVTLKRDGVVLDLVPPPTKVNNLIFGRTWVDSPGEMVLSNLTTGDKVVLYFQPCGWFGYVNMCHECSVHAPHLKFVCNLLLLPNWVCFRCRAGRYEVDGYVYNAAEEPKVLITGKWNESMSYQPCDMEGEPLPGTELKEAWRIAAVPENDKFQYTYFAHKINSFETAPKKLLASDSRLRPDRYALEKGDLSKSGAEKSRLEETQRAEKKQREAKGHQFKPRWFDLTDEIRPTPWGDLEVYQYNGKYTEHRAAVDSSGSTVVDDVTSTEFNPWQYGNISS